MKSNSSDDDDTPSVEMKTMMMTTSRHYFTETNDDGVVDDKADFAVSIIENMKEEYGLLVWPCSVILAEYVWQQRLRFSGISVVELGAETSLPGLVAAKVGADVTLTDSANRLELFEIDLQSISSTHPNAEMNEKKKC
ncbi:hypothetical protein ACFE04_023965 [Oxalis oulophora]